MREHAIPCMSLPAHGPHVRNRPDAWHDSGLCDACLAKRDRVLREAAAEACDSAKQGAWWK